MSHDFMIFYKVNKKDIGNLRNFFELYEIRKDGYFRNKNSLSLKLTSYFTIKNEKKFIH
jgi:hypothetical protein